MRILLLARRAAASLGAAALVATLVPAPAAAARWAPVDEATIRPGVQMYTEGAQCTGNFVFTDARRRVYVGYAAHCAGTGEATETDGCTSASLPLGTKVVFGRGGSVLLEGTKVGRGRLVYSSWLTMQRLGATDPDACAFNDFALVRVGGPHRAKVNPSVPFWGGPVGLAPTGSAFGDRMVSYGSSGLRGGMSVLGPKDGRSLGSDPSGWEHLVYSLSPGVPGDSGSGYLDADGRAVGVLSTLGLAPLPASNGVGDLRRELRFAQQHAGLPKLRLVKGTEPFRPAL